MSYNKTLFFGGGGMKKQNDIKDAIFMSELFLCPRYAPKMILGTC